MELPQHIAIIMDGNGRWAKKRLLPRIAGHQQGMESVRAMISHCSKIKIPYLTLFAFSSENWRRPESEISFLLGLFLKSLKGELKALAENNVRLRIIGEKTRFSKELQNAIEEAEVLTENNKGLMLNIAFNYGGKWDIVQAAQKLCDKVVKQELNISEINEEVFQDHLCLSDCPMPDLLIRTSGEYRISNFLLWQFAYAELYFTDTLWPDFREAQLEEALKTYNSRQRRFGYIEEQLEIHPHLEIIEQQAHA